MTLHEEYRPQTLADVVGQHKACAVVNSLIARKSLGGRAYWISGPSGSGKTTLARIIARESGGTKFSIIEFDSADQVGQEELDHMSRELHLRSAFGSRVWIINEAHGLRKPAIRQLLGMLERMPADALVIFTTTQSGQRALFDGQIDAGPLLSRCLVLALNDTNTPEIAAHVRMIAQAVGMDGRPLPEYEALASRCQGNIRAMFQAIEAGEMLT